MTEKREAKPAPIEKQLWKAADKLRKNIDAAEYKHIVLGLIFLKYISDAFEALQKTAPDHIDYALYRSAIIREFEIILEQTGKLLRKCSPPFFAHKKQLDQLYFKNTFRAAVKHGLISLEETERWLRYRDNRNITSHDYGVGFANHTLRLVPQFIKDAKNVVALVKRENGTER